MRCFKARDGNGWQVSQQHTVAWRLAEYIVRRRRRLHTGGEAAARQWRRRHTAQQAGRGGNGGPDRVHCQAPATADTIGAPSTQTRPKASFGRWKAVLLLLQPAATAVPFFFPFKMLQTWAKPPVWSTWLRLTRTLYYYVLLQQSLSLPAATSISYAKARPYTSIIATFKMNESSSV